MHGCKNDLKIHEQQIPEIIKKLENKEAILPKYDAGSDRRRPGL